MRHLLHLAGVMGLLFAMGCSGTPTKPLSTQLPPPSADPTTGQALHPPGNPKPPPPPSK